MQLTMFWVDEGGDRSPRCKSGLLNASGVDFVSCLLSDDGGQGYRATLPWLMEGLSKISSVKRGEISEADWSRDNWGAQLKNGVAKIYSLHDDDYFLTTTLEELESALLQWKTFLANGPQSI